jgi:GTPase-activator protein for Ras-like GTPase
VIGPSIQRLAVSGAIKTVSLEEGGSPTAIDRAKRLTRETSRVAKAIAKSSKDCPAMLREVFKYLHESVAERFLPEAVNARQVLSGFVLLRFFIAATKAPAAYGILEESASASDSTDELFAQEAGWGAVGRILQCMANGSMFPPTSKSEEAREAAAIVNKFLRRNREVFPSFVESLVADA